MEMDTTYKFKEFEKKINLLWEDTNAFHVESDDEPSGSEPSDSETIDKQKPFVVVIPPPNVTGVLHMGHGLNHTIHDVLIRYHRMKGKGEGYDSLWIPGSDHAGIATQQVMEREIAKDNVSKHDLGREVFVDKTWSLANKHKDTIRQQIKSMGASCDWERERFTLDEGLSKAVRAVFVNLYEKGLVYRGNYLVNWSVDAGTALSDDEVVHKEVHGHLYHIRYPFADGNTETALVVATTRPETMLGDTAVAVNPNDMRYKHLIGNTIQLPISERAVCIIGDEYVDMEFGTGVVKITPAHDYNDYEMGKRHNLECLNILNTDGTLNNNVPAAYQGLKIKEARKNIVAELECLGLLDKVEDHMHQVGHCYRTGCVVEPLFSTQWFVKMDGMAKKALHALHNGDIRFYPKYWENTYTQWLENIRDWCISRQLWWGHRIPVWYNDETGEVIVSVDDPTTDPKYAGIALRQDEDVLDTWFSSWLWPFSVLGWPENTDDLRAFYPTSTVVTAYDIIFFWVARMIMAGLEFTGQVPFRDIYMHGLVRDDKGKKMSKSLGNGIDPLEIIEEFGTDALRFTLAFMCKLGGDILLKKDSFLLGSKFSNKVWNASRFLLMNLQGVSYRDIDVLELRSTDRWILAKMRSCIEQVDIAMEHYRLDDAAHKVYEYFWTDFCDWYVEIAKIAMNKGVAEEKEQVASILLWVLIQNLKILHPFLPFITEEIYQHILTMIGNTDGILVPVLASAQSVVVSDRYVVEKELLQFKYLQELVTGVRTLRSEFNMSPKILVPTTIYCEDTALLDYFSTQIDSMRVLIGAETIDIEKRAMRDTDKGIGIEGSVFTVMVDVYGIIDIAQERLRIKKKLEKLEKQKESISQRLKNPAFIEKAHAEYIEEMQSQATALDNKTGQLHEFMKRLEG